MITFVIFQLHDLLETSTEQVNIENIKTPYYSIDTNIIKTRASEQRVRGGKSCKSLQSIKT